MAEEYRFFLRSLLYIVVAGAIYWFVSYEPAGTVLLIGLAVAIVAFVGVARAFSGPSLPSGNGTGLLGTLNRLIGFADPPETSPPLEGGPDLIPLGSTAPILTAAGIVVIGLGLVFGWWLIVAGGIVAAIGLFGWLTQLDRVDRA